VQTFETPVIAIRSCFRCGSDFRRNAGNRICPSCRVETAKLKKPLNPELSFREKQLVNLVSQGKLNKQIAYELHLTEGTVKEYMNRIFRKLGTSNRTELAVWALTRRMQDLLGSDQRERASVGELNAIPG
jgi:DNA-binding NarL/FixJ family response regulator